MAPGLTHPPAPGPPGRAPAGKLAPDGHGRDRVRLAGPRVTPLR
jgi:hypothetical protein